MYKIYCATNKNNNKKYIGMTGKSIDERIKEHLYESRTNTGRYFHRSLKKYGFDNFKWEILDETEIKDIAFEIEKRLIIELNTKAPNGYNLTDGGDGLIGFEVTEEHKNKISQSIRGSDEPIVLYRNNIKYEFDNISAFAREKGLHQGCLSKVINGKLRQHKGFHLKNTYLGNEKNKRIREIKTCSYRVYFVDGSYKDFIKTDQRILYEKFNLSPVVFNSLYKKRKPHKRTGITKIEKI